MFAWLIQLIIHYKYALLILIAIPEGPVIMLLSGALVKLQYISFWPAYFSLIFGDLIADIIWYCLGHFGGMRFVDRFGKYFGITRPRVEMIGRFFHKYHGWILFITKMTTGFGLAVVVLITAGMVKIPFKRYMAIIAFGQFLWTGMLMFLGYTFVHLYVLIDDILGRITFIAAAIIAAVFIYNFMKFMHKKIETKV